MKRFEQGRTMNTRGLGLLILALIMTLLVSSCGGAEETKSYRVGILAGLAFVQDIEVGFRDAMTELGYIEGENITYDVEIVDFDIPTYQNILQQFVADEVDLIVVFPTEATIEAKNITAGTDIPVVFTFALIEDMGVVDSIQEPGGNITGVRYPGVDITILRYEMLREIMPDVDKIVVPYQAGYPIIPPQLDLLRATAEEDGVTLLEVPASTAAEVEAFFDDLVASGDTDVDAILALVDPLVTVPEVFAAIADFGTEYQVPFAGVYNTAGDYSSIFGVNVELLSSGALAAPIADKVLQGTDPGTIPVASAEPYIEINYTMTQALGLEVPEPVLATADQIYR